MTDAQNTDPVSKLKAALAEVRANRPHFSDEAFSAIVMAVLERIRRLQTVIDKASPTSDEIRLVTVMFVDVKDSTTLAQQMDTGDFKTILEEAHKRMAGLVTQWDGTIGQYLGDGILAFFGAQKSRGDDALRCVACAIAINSAMESYANEVFLEYGVEFGIRTGISTGKLVVGMVGSADRQELLALGPATNLAARLQTEAPSGGIYVDSATYSRVRGQFNLKLRPMVRVKGFDEPIIMYAVMGRNEGVATQLASTTLSDLPVPLVGRDDIIQTITDEMRIVIEAQNCHVITVLGDIGMGKSRLLQEILNKTHEWVFFPLVMVAHYETRTTSHNLLSDFLAKYCHLTDDMPPHIVRQQIVNNVVNTWNDPSAQQTAEVMGYLAGYGFEDSPFVQSLFIGNDKRQTLVFRWIGRFLRGIAQQNHAPLLLIVDNLQWADSDSVALLEYLVHELQDMPALIVAGARPAFRLTYPNYMADYATHQMLTLERLSNENTVSLLEQILKPIERVPATMLTVITERAEGNPLFVLEFLGMLFDSGVFQKNRDGKWRFNIILYDSAFKNLPAGLVEVVQSRLDDLSNEARHTLQLAAITGQTFWNGIVSEMLGKDATAILDSLALRGIIVAHNESTFEDDAQYSFRHSLYRDVAYEMLPRAKREQYHRQVAKWLITRISGKPDYFSILADQFEAGGEHEAALFTYLEAVQNRGHRGLLSEMLILIERALAMSRNLPRDVAIGVTVQLWTLRSQALSGLGRFEEATASAQSALRLFDEMPNQQLTAVKVNAGRLLGTSSTSLGNYEQASQILTQTYEWLDENDNGQMASVLRAFGMLNLYRGRLTDALAYQQRALTYARNTGHESQISATLTHLGSITLERGDVATALGYFETCLEMNHQRNFMHYEASDLRSIGYVYMTLQTFDRAQTVLEMASAFRDQLGETDTLLQAFQALCAIELGQKSAGLDRLKQLVKMSHRDVNSQQRVRLAWLEGLIRGGEYAEAVREAQLFIKDISLVSHLLHARATLRLGRAKYFLGEPDALTLLQMGLDWEQEYGGREVWQACVWIAEASSPAQAKRYYERAAQVLQTMGNSLYAKADLQYAFLHSPRVSDIFKIAGIQN